jgi:hypothetical protein
VATGKDGAPIGMASANASYLPLPGREPFLVKGREKGKVEAKHFVVGQFRDSGVAHCGWPNTVMCI